MDGPNGKLPDSNLIWSVILDEAISIWMVSLALMIGSGYRRVRPSCVTKNGTPLAPNCVFFTLHNLYCKENRIEEVEEEEEEEEIQHDVCLYSLGL